MRALKIVSIVIGALVALIVVGLVLVVIFVNPNDYRDQIANTVQEKTGRKLTLAGDLKLGLYPWLALSIGEASLSESPAFGTEPFVAFKEAKVGIRLLPLLKGSIEVGNVALVGARVRLITDQQGRHNWDDLVTKQSNTAAAPGGGPTKLPTVAGLEIRDAAVTLEDRQAKSRQE